VIGWEKLSRSMVEWFLPFRVLLRYSYPHMEGLETVIDEHFCDD